MPRYFFHIRDGDDFIEDLEGGNLPDTVSAVREARVSVREIVADRIRQGISTSSPIIEICDIEGRKLAELDLPKLMRPDTA